MDPEMQSSQVPFFFFNNSSLLWFITREGNGRAQTNAYIEGKTLDVGADIFNRGLCLPSDNKMTIEEQEQIIEIVKSCFK